MPLCCNKIHVGWICPRCGIAMAIKSHTGNEPISVGKIQNVTIVQGDYVKGSIIKDSVVMGDVSSETADSSVNSDGDVVEGNISEDSIVGVANDSDNQSALDDIIYSVEDTTKQNSDSFDNFLNDII